MSEVANSFKQEGKKLQRKEVCKQEVNKWTSKQIDK